MKSNNKTQTTTTKATGSANQRPTTGLKVLTNVRAGYWFGWLRRPPTLS
jgi:hypothetical protein